MIENHFKKLVLLLLFVGAVYAVYATRYQHIEGQRYFDRWKTREVEIPPGPIYLFEKELQDSLNQKRKSSVFGSLPSSAEDSTRILEIFRKRAEWEWRQAVEKRDWETARKWRAKF